jgi:hypothetical protein
LKAFLKGYPRRLAEGPPAVAAAGWLLRLAVLGYCVGAACTLFHKLGSGLGTYYFLEWDVAHPQVAYWERMAAYGLLGLGIAAFLRPHWVVLAPIAAVTIAEGWARYFNGGSPFSEWTLWAYALRYTAPLALALLFLSVPVRWTGPPAHLAAVAWLLRIATAVVFAVHGLEAILQHPRFIDYIIGTAENLGGFRVSETQAGVLLKIIGAVDIAVAALVLVRPFQAVLFWMAFWGLITALGRVTTFGPGVYFEVLLRFSHFLAPLAIWFLVCAGKTRHESAPVPSATADRAA